MEFDCSEQWMDLTERLVTRKKTALKAKEHARGAGLCGADPKQQAGAITVGSTKHAFYSLPAKAQTQITKLMLVYVYKATS